MQRRRKKKKVRRTAAQRAAAREATRACRERMRRGHALYVVAVDFGVLDALLHQRYLTDPELLDKRRVNRALSVALWDWSRGRKFL